MKSALCPSALRHLARRPGKARSGLDLFLYLSRKPFVFVPRFPWVFWHLPADIPSIFTQAGVFAQVLLTCGTKSVSFVIILRCSTSKVELAMKFRHCGRCSQILFHIGFQHHTRQTQHACMLDMFFFFVFARSWTFFFLQGPIWRNAKKGRFFNFHFFRTLSFFFGEKVMFF